MRSRLRLVGIGVLVLAGCATGARFAADLPQARPLPMVHSLDDDAIFPQIGLDRSALVPPPFRPPQDVLIPVVHPPDALIIARETETRWERRLHAAGARTSPVLSWSLLALVLVAF